MAKTELPATLKFRRLVSRLGVPAPHVLGYLDLMWITAWESGIVAYHSLDDIEIAAGWIGEPGAFSTLLVSEGWIDETDLGFEIHDWWEHAPTYIKKRKSSLLIALGRGYEGIQDQWLKDRGLSRYHQLASGKPLVDPQSTNGPQDPTQPNPTQPSIHEGLAPTKKTTKFTPPTLDEVRAYVKEKGYHFDPETFFAHHATRGWKLKGGQMMANWHMACVTFEKNVPLFGGTGTANADDPPTLAEKWAREDADQ